jgi:hypothetical protein
MSDLGRRFDPAELDDEGRRPTDADAAGLLATARDLEAFARAETTMPTTDFEDRVMAAIAKEPPPRPRATGRGLIGLLVAVRDAWLIAWSGGRPLAVRAQAFALLLVAALAVGSVGSLATVGVARLLAPDATPAPTVPPLPSPSPSIPPSVAPSASPAPSVSLDPSLPPSPSPTATDDDGGGGSATAEPTETPEGTDDSSGPGPGEGSEDDSSGKGSGDDSSGPGSGGDDGSDSGPGSNGG